MFSNQRNVLNLNAHVIPPENTIQFPVLTTPESFGGYSLSPLGFLENHMRGMRYIVVPSAQNFPLNLRDSDHIKTAKLSERHLDNLLEFIVQSSPQSNFLRASNMRMHVNADIVCTSEVLELMMRAPYEHKAGWTLAVTRFRNTTYICRVASTQAEDAFEEHNLKRIMQEARLRKLHQYCLSENGLVMPDKILLCEEHNRFNGVFSIYMNGLRVLFDSPVLAEMNPNQFNGPGHMWSELQLRQDNMNRLEWAEHNRTEALKWWCKCFLLNIQNFFVAYQNENAYVHTIQKTSLNELWKACENEWRTSVCANFMVCLLGCITQIMAHIDCFGTVYLFDFDAKLGEVAYEVFEGLDNEHSFLGDWFRIHLDERLEDMPEPMNLY
ncbi:protein cutoff [Drosophila kikkawai]|uniref:Decapping nuclease n=1 Tax=Drosophila kikkawai TaxID=30033 RepID=A0A6P4JDC4_DROKI|nr:protein cutoff [Drosophila kikkawai]